MTAYTTPNAAPEPRSRLRVRIVLATLSTCGLAALAWASFVQPAAHVVYNRSNSVPVGWYRIEPINLSADSLHVGSIVLARLPAVVAALAAQRGYLPSHIPLLKRVGAVAPQHVCIVNGVVRIDGVPAATFLRTDRMGRPLSPWPQCRPLAEGGRTIVGRVAGKGLADELYDKGYLIVDGTDGKAHYVVLPPRTELEQYPTGAVVEIKGSAAVRAADKTIAAMATDGIYRTDHHLAIAKAKPHPDCDPHEVVDAHVHRLEVLRRAGLVERLVEGVWKVPDDLPEQGRQCDAQRLGGMAVELRSHLPIERQARVIGATWLDQQLIGGGKGLGELGFGSEVRDALQQRSDFLVDQGLAERRGKRVILARHLLATLRGRELATAGQSIAAETGLQHRTVADGERVSGVYRRSVMLASGRFAMLDDGLGFRLVPWKPVIEQRLGQAMAATVRGGGVSWEVGRRHGPSVS